MARQTISALIDLVCINTYLMEQIASLLSAAVTVQHGKATETRLSRKYFDIISVLKKSSTVDCC